MPKYKNISSPQSFILDPTDTEVWGFALSYSIIAHGEVVTKKANHTLPGEKRFPFDQTADMELVSTLIWEAIQSEGLIEAAETEMTALLAGKGVA